MATAETTTTTLTQLAEEIARHLSASTGERWERIAHDDSDWDAYNAARGMSGRAELRNADKPDAELCLQVDARKPRLHISGRYQFYNGTAYPLRDEDRTPNISVATTRTAEEIARDITRRYLPAYMRALDLAADQIRIDRAWDDGRAALTRRLATIAGAEPQIESKTFYAWSRGQERPYTHARVDSPDSVELSIRSLNPAQAEKVLRALYQE